MSNSVLTGERVPDVSVEQRKLDRARKQLQKLRWIGREKDAEQMLRGLSEPGLRLPAASKRRMGLRL
jgi:hypothetical protein